MDPKSNFLTDLIDADLAAGRHTGVVTRFPPEPNGYLHIGHAKSICLNFGLAERYGGRCHMRFDDTNPSKENQDYVDAILRDVRWLGFDWGDHLHYASDYFEACYELAEKLILAGRAYVDSQNEEEIRLNRGTVEVVGTPSPYRTRSVEENLDLFRRMRAGEFPDGAHVLRAKGDMAAKNMKLRDPLLYRIRHVHHHRVGNAWCIYPMYDYNHPISDALEHITHSICTLEFENNRDIYDWVVENCDVPSRPHQYEFARLELTYIVTSKRKLLRLVTEGHVDGWDDPRMPTLAGLRRRGVRPEALRLLMDRVGVAKANSTVDYEALEVAIRDDLNPIAPRVMAVLDPVELLIDGVEPTELELPFGTEDLAIPGTRKVPFGPRLYVEREDYADPPPAGWHRLAPGRLVRLRGGPVVECLGRDGEQIVCRVVDAKKVAGTIHWVDADAAVDVEVRLYDRLFAVADPEAGEDFVQNLNPDNLRVVRAKAEPWLATAAVGERVQFQRLGYFRVDAPGVFHRIVTLKDGWTKAAPKPVVDAPKPVAVQPTRVVGDPAARDRLVAAGVPEMAAIVLADDAELRALHEGAGGGATVANLVVNEVAALRKAGSTVMPAQVAGVAALLDAGEVNARTARELLGVLAGTDGDARAVATARGLLGGVDAAAVAAAAAKVVAESPAEAAAYRGGKAQLLGFFIGKVMKATGGKAKPDDVRAAVLAALG